MGSYLQAFVGAPALTSRRWNCSPIIGHISPQKVSQKKLHRAFTYFPSHIFTIESSDDRIDSESATLSSDSDYSSAEDESESVEAFAGADSQHESEDDYENDDSHSVDLDQQPTDFEDNGGSGGYGGDDYGGSGGDQERYGSDDEHRRSSNGVVLAFKNATTAAQSATSNISEALSSATSNVISWGKDIVSTVPSSVLVAMLSLLSTLFGIRYRAFRDERDAAKNRAEAARRRKMEIERELRKTYELFAAPLMKSAAKFSERLWYIVNADWSSMETSDHYANLSSLYSAYLLGRFLSYVEILKNERALLDYGFPTADRMLANILGRVQGVLCANDNTLNHIQNSEHFFKPAPHDKTLPGGPLKISPRKQAVLGDLMLRKLWKGKYNIDLEHSGEDLNRGSKAVLSFLEFVHIFEKDKRMKWWYKDIVDDFTDFERLIHKRKKGRGRNHRVGARVFVLQSALIDIVEFFDPNPHPQSIPNRHRTRLQIGPNSYAEEVRSPLSLKKLYQEIAQFRDHREHSDDRAARLSLPYGIEVFVTGKYHAGDPRMEVSEHGSCPHSHRVLIALREMGVPYHTIPILPDNKPAWFYLLNPVAQTPVIYHNGNVIADSSNIMMYVEETFGQRYKLASADHLKLAVGSSAFVRFHTHFKKWIRGDESEKEHLELELRNLDCTLRQAQFKNNGAPFLGGESFSKEDTAIVPCLHVVEVGGRRLKGWTIPRDCTSVYKYLSAARKMPSFRDSGAREDSIVCRLKAVQDIQEHHSARLADMLE